MIIASKPQLFVDGLDRQTLEVLHKLSQAQFVQSYYMAGGTALTLYLQHRISYDLDFFSPQATPPNTIKSQLDNLGELTIFQNDLDTFYGSLESIKLSFFTYQYPLLKKPSDFHGVCIASLEDIACMKLEAIASRGVKRDFIDLYCIAEKIELSIMLELFEQKFANHAVSPVHVLKSLVYFADAESDPMPNMLIDLDWDEVKRFFERSVKEISSRRLLE